MAQAASAANEAADRDLLSPDHYAEVGYPHEAWARLRREDPVHWVADWAGDPYWAITRHADIVEVSKQPDLFVNSSGTSWCPTAKRPRAFATCSTWIRPSTACTGAWSAGVSRRGRCSRSSSGSTGSPTRSWIG